MGIFFPIKIQHMMRKVNLPSFKIDEIKWIFWSFCSFDRT